MGVARKGNKWGASITAGGRQFFFGAWPTKDQAARAYDEARIFLHKEPVNFSLSEYCVEEVRRHATLDEFAKQKRQALRRTASINQASRFVGVCRYQAKWWAYAYVQRQKVTFGGYYTEEEAAKAVDRALIYMSLQPVNFPGDKYDVEIIRQAATLQDYVQASRQAAKDLTRERQTSRFVGVSTLERKYVASGPGSIKLGSFFKEKDAARVYDRACIYQGKPPVNFPEFKYDTEAIQQVPDWAAFVEQCRKEAEKASKAVQHSKYTGVTWFRGKWEAYFSVADQHGNKTIKKLVGHFSSEVAAAVATDRARVLNGQQAVNFPDRMP